MPALLRREQVRLEETWNLADIYATVDAWEADAARLDGEMATVAAYRGRLHEGAAILLACLQARDTLAERLEHVATYAQLRASVDGLAPDNQAMVARVAALKAAAGAAQSFLITEVAALSEDTIEGYLRAEPALEVYRHWLEQVLQRAGHVLAPAAEEVLAALGETLDSPYSVYQRTTSADLVCPPIQDASGQEVPVSIARYVFGLAQSADRGVRRQAYASLATGIGAHKATLAATLATFIRRNVTIARLRGYGSAREMILDRQGVTPEIYHHVLHGVHDQLAPHMRRLLALRRRVLAVDRLYRYDLEAPLDAGYDPPVTFAEGSRLIREALTLLGQRYDAMLASAFQDRWIDRADNAGKRSGAFCRPLYGVHPYVFTTWQDTMRSVFILAHELGHCGHAYLASEVQPFSGAPVMESDMAEGRKLFVEAPSTANELLLGRHLLETANDPRLRRWLISQLIATFTHNMVTHLLEAHFEDRLYALAEAGQPLTLATIQEVQEAVFERFFAGMVVIDEGARLYWAQQPHFYMGGLYPYTYSAGLIGAYSVAEAIRVEGQPAVDRWLGTLEAGMTLPAVELMRRAGVDLADEAPVRRAVGYFGTLVDELERGFA